MPFVDGTPSGAPIDVLTGFLNRDGEAYGRPVGVAIDKHGALLVADDVGNAVWRVAADPPVERRQGPARYERPGRPFNEVWALGPGAAR